MSPLLTDIGRIGIGLVFLSSVYIDLKCPQQLFNLMTIKKVPFQRLCYIGGMSWKVLTSIGLIFSIYPLASALLLALYIFIANVIFNNFWNVPTERRDFTFILFTTNLAVIFGLLAVAGSL